MAQYPAPPPLRLPDGTLVPQGNDGTQNWQADGTSFQAPNANGASRYLQDRSLDDGYQSAADGARRATAVQDVLKLQPPAFTGAAATPAAGSRGGQLLNTLSGLLGKGGKRLAGAAGSVGSTIQKNPLGALNAGLGLAGALQYATAKAPAIPGRPDVYAPAIRPAQGLNSGSLEAARRGVQSAQLQTSRAVGADTSTTSATRLLAQQQAGEQQSALSMKDNEAFQTDQRRVDEQSNAAYDANYKTQRSYEEKKYDLQQRQFEARRQQGAAMGQAALTYFTQDRADQRNSLARAHESALYAQNGVTPYWMRAKQSAARSGQVSNQMGGPLTPAEVDLDGNPVSQAKGGVIPGMTLTSTTKIKRGGAGNAGWGGGVSSKAAEAFAQQMQQITAQATQAFHASLREASNKRAKGFSGK